MKKIAIIGAGKGGHALLNLLKDVAGIKMAGIYNQSCSLLIIAVDDMQVYIAKNGELHGNAVLRKVLNL